MAIFVAKNESLVNIMLNENFFQGFVTTTLKVENYFQSFHKKLGAETINWKLY